MPQRNQEKDSKGKRSLFQEERTTKRRIEKMSQEKNGENTDLECDLIHNERNNRKKNGGQKRKEKTKVKLLHWMMSERYSKLKEEAQHRETWSHWTSRPDRGQRT